MRQIFILEKEELDDLRRGEPLKIMFGDQTITLQADVIRRPFASKGNGVQSLPVGGKTITDSIPDYIRTHGPASVREISEGMGVPRTAVSSAVTRLTTTLKRTGHGLTAVWGLKSEPDEAGEKKRYEFKSGKQNVTMQVLEYLGKYGPTRAAEISRGLGAKKQTVISALIRSNGTRVKRRGKFKKTVWSLK